MHSAWMFLVVIMCCEQMSVTANSSPQSWVIKGCKSIISMSSPYFPGFFSYLAGTVYLQSCELQTFHRLYSETDWKLFCSTARNWFSAFAAPFHFFHCDDGVTGCRAFARRRRRVWIARLCAAVHDRHAALHGQHSQRHCPVMGCSTFQPAVGPVSPGHWHTTCQVLVTHMTCARPLTRCIV